MKKIIPQLSLSVLLLSTLIYVVGRWLVQDRMSDDTGDWFLWSGGIATLILLYFITKGMPVNIRQSINIATTTTILFLVAFGAWGLLSTAGQKQFPEMAGLLPFYALILAGILLLSLIIAHLIWRSSANK
ncbi:MAG: hypothetical protein ABL891_14775 [Burkholderiales bacterium]